MLTMKRHAPVTRWIPIGLGLGFGLVLTMVLPSLPNVDFISRYTKAERLRRDVASTAITVARQLQQNPNASPVELDVLLAGARKASPRRIAWIQLRQGDNTVLAQAGIETQPAFTLQYVKARLASRKAAVKYLDRPEGRVLVEAFPIRLTGARGSMRVLRAAHTSRTATSPNAVLEIAAYQ